MLKKSTFHLENELKKADSLDSFLEEHESELEAASLASQLQLLISGKGMIKADVVRESNLNSVYAYQILAGKRKPSRDKLLALCFAMNATLEETQILLRRNESATLYVKNRRDSIIIFALSRGHSLIQVNSALYEHGEVIIE